MKCREKHHSLGCVIESQRRSCYPTLPWQQNFWISTHRSLINMAEKKKRKNSYVWLSCTWLKSGTKQPILFSSVWQCKWPSLSTTTVEIHNFCYLSNVTSNFSLNKLIKCRVALVVNCNLFHFSHYTLFSCTYYVHWQWTPVFQTHAITAARAFWEMKAALSAAVPQSFRGQHVKASLTRIKSR